MSRSIQARRASEGAIHGLAGASGLYGDSLLLLPQPGQQRCFIFTSAPSAGGLAASSGAAIRYDRKLVRTCCAFSAASARRRSRAPPRCDADENPRTQHAARFAIAVAAFPTHTLLFEPQVKLERDRPVGQTPQAVIARSAISSWISLPSILKIFASWSATNPRSFSIAILTGTGVTIVC